MGTFESLALKLGTVASVSLVVEAARNSAARFPISTTNDTSIPPFHHNVASTQSLVWSAVMRRASSRSVPSEAAAEERGSLRCHAAPIDPCPYRTILYGCFPTAAAALVGHLKMRESPPLSPLQPPCKADAESKGSHRLGQICTSPLPTTDINFSSPTIKLNDDAMSLFESMSSKTFPLDVFTSKGLVCTACSSFTRYPFLKPRQKSKLPLKRGGSTLSHTAANTISTPARRPSTVLYPLYAARYTFNRSMKSFRSWSTSGWGSSSASRVSTDMVSSPAAPVPMTVDDGGSRLFRDIDELGYKVNHYALNSTQQLHLRDILHVQELDDFFTECKNLEIETGLFDGSESGATDPVENSCAPIESCGVEDNLSSSIMLYAGLRQCGGLAQGNRGRVPHNYWSMKDEELMQSNREASRARFLAGRAAAKEQSKMMEESAEEVEEEIAEEIAETSPT